MRLGRGISIAILAATFAAGTSAGPVTAPPAEAAPIREVRAGRITAYVPAEWSVRPMPSRSSASHGLQASENLRRWAKGSRRETGLEAYWVDAARVGVPSDYYYLAAGGPAMARLAGQRACGRPEHRVLADRRPLFDRSMHSPGDYVATASSTCRSRGREMRWASFVAAPGFGPVGRIGIPESGLYYALVVIPEGPRAGTKAKRMLSRVRFGDTAVAEFLAVVGGRT